MSETESVTVLSVAASRYAEVNDDLGFLSCLWWADLRVIERGLYDAWPDATRHEWFLLWSEIIQAINYAHESSSGRHDTLATLIHHQRETAIAVLKQHDIDLDARRFADVAAGGQMRVPTRDHLAAEAQRRLGGLAVEEFVAIRRRESVDSMIKAHREIVDGDVSAAIAHAYDSDMTAIDAYLADSANAAGDSHLMSWIARWELVSARVSSISALPRGLSAATTAVRTHVAEALGEPDASRLLATLQQV